jgi:hypothetical protein
MNHTSGFPGSRGDGTCYIRLVLEYFMAFNDANGVTKYSNQVGGINMGFCMQALKHGQGISMHVSPFKTWFLTTSTVSCPGGCGNECDYSTENVGSTPFSSS